MYEKSSWYTDVELQVPTELVEMEHVWDASTGYAGHALHAPALCVPHDVLWSEVDGHAFSAKNLG